MKRVQVADLQNVLLQPQARRVDAFAQAGGPDPSQPLRQLAGALGDAVPKLTRWLDNKEAGVKEESILRAQRDRMKHQVSFAEGVSAGLISEGENPYYVRAYKEIDGELAGKQQYGQALHEAWQQSGLATMDFPSEGQRYAALTNFIHEQRAAFLEGKDDIYWVDGARKGIDAAEAALVQRHQEAAITANTQKANAATEAKIEEFLFMDGDKEAKAALIAAFGQDRNGKFGLNFEKYNDMTLNQVTSVSYRQALAGDYAAALETLSILDHIPTSAGNTLGSTGKSREAVNNMVAKIENLQKSRDQYQWSLQTREWSINDERWKRFTRNKQMEEFAQQDRLGEMHLWIAENPDGDFEQALSAMIQADPKMAKHAQTLRGVYQARIRADRVVREDALAVMSLRHGIEKGTIGADELMKRAAAQELSYDTFMGLMDDLARQHKARGLTDALPQEARGLINDYESELRKVAVGSELNPLPGSQAKAANAVRLYKAMYLDYLSDPNNPRDVISLQKKLEEIFMSISQSAFYRQSLNITPKVMPMDQLQQQVQPLPPPAPVPGQEVNPFESLR